MAFKRAIVTAVGPLRILIDGDTVPIPFTPKSLIDPATLAVDDVVHADQSGHRLVVLGRVGGAAPWTAYSPGWYGTGTNPTLGNGTLTGAYAQVGKVVTYQVHLTAGSTTTFGAGLYSLSLPVAFVGTSTQACLGTVVARTDSGYISGAAMFQTSTQVYLLLGTTLMTPTAPGTFSSGRTISVNGSYEVA